MLQSESNQQAEQVIKSHAAHRNPQIVFCPTRPNG